MAYKNATAGREKEAARRLRFLNTKESAETPYTLAKLQIGADPAWAPPAYDPAHPNVSQEYWRKRQALAERVQSQRIVRPRGSIEPLLFTAFGNVPERTISGQVTISD